MCSVNCAVLQPQLLDTNSMITTCAPTYPRGGACPNPTSSAPTPQAPTHPQLQFNCRAQYFSTYKTPIDIVWHPGAVRAGPHRGMVGEHSASQARKGLQKYRYAVAEVTAFLLSHLGCGHSFGIATLEVSYTMGTNVLGELAV